MELDSILSITKEGAAFAGWRVYDVSNMETIEGPVDAGDAPCFEVWDNWYTILWDYTILHEGISTEELKQVVCGETDLFACALWNE